jgi:hypothetical protein
VEATPQRYAVESASTVNSTLLTARSKENTGPSSVSTAKAYWPAQPDGVQAGVVGADREQEADPLDDAGEVDDGLVEQPDRVGQDAAVVERDAVLVGQGDEFVDDALAGEQLVGQVAHGEVVGDGLDD